MPLASDVMDETAVLCGDRNKTLYTPEKLLPLLIRANRDLSLAFQLAGVGSVEDVHLSTELTAVTGVTYPTPPTDMASPIRLWERPSPSTSEADWVLMYQYDWPATETQEILLRYWQWKEDLIIFVGALEAKKLRLEYYKNLGTITGTGSTITTPNAEHFLAVKTASYAARFIGKNVALGAELNREAQEALDLLLAIRVKEDQNVVLRMKPYSMNARR